MPQPFTYQSASADYETYLNDLLTISGLATWNQCYTMTRAVFIVFRSHVPPQLAMEFVQSLPAVLRAIFIEDWNLSQPAVPFPDHETLTKEVQAVREAHNFSTPNAIAEVALALKHAMKAEDYRSMLKRLPADARDFWATT
jgi:uncharacterized protein (DUF2267 family)